MAIVGRFRDLPGAEVASATLEAAGIENCLLDACTVSASWTYATALGWIRLSVGDSDFESARCVLEQTEAIEWPAPELGESAERCSVCGSEDLEIVSGPRKTLSLMLITWGIPVWFWRSKLRCISCGSSHVVPLRFRPDLVGAWLIGAVGICLLTGLVVLIAGYIIRGPA